MTPEDITEIITRRMQAAIKKLNESKTDSVEWIEAKAVILELSETVHEIRETK